MGLWTTGKSRKDVPGEGRGEQGSPPSPQTPPNPGRLLRGTGIVPVLPLKILGWGWELWEGSRFSPLALSPKKLPELDLLYG
jgi:hypothetical protein